MPDNPTSGESAPVRRARRASTTTTPRTPRRPAATRARRAEAPTPEPHAEKHRQSLWEWIEAAGVELVGVQRLRFLLHRFGLKGILVLALVGGYPLGQYSLISYAVNSSLPAMAGDFGLEFEAEEWSYRPFSLSAVARNVTMRSKHDVQHDGPPLFKAGQLEFHGSVFSLLRGVKELVTLNTFHTFNEITVKDAQLHLERSRTGALNWSEFEEGFPEERLREVLSGLYQVRAVILDNVRIEYIENLAGDSGGGVIQTAQAKVFVDGIRGSITEIGPASAGERMPTRIKVEARSSDGTINIDGKLAFRPERLADAPAVRVASVAGGTTPTPTTVSADGFGYDLVLDLTNIGAAAFVRTMPPTAITATSGSVHGRLTVRSQGTPPCESALQMENVVFAPNPQLVRSREQYDVLQRQLQGIVVTKPYKACDAVNDVESKSPPRSNGQGGQVRYASRMMALTTSFNEQATASAPAEVRAAVARDSYALTGKSAANAILNDVTSQMTNEIAGRIGGQTGMLLQQAAGTRPSATRSAAPAPSNDNAVARGAKGLGNGIKRLFGGGGGKKPPANSSNKDK
jgi:hypothetical protein